jgi:NAD(P)H dehydrogenase (quinone)
LTDDHAATEEALEHAGPSWTLLRNALYLEAISGGWPQAVATGKLISNNGAGLHAPIARDDAAAAAAAVLLGDDHDNAVDDIAGQRLLDDTAIAGFGATIRAGLMQTPLGDTEKLIGRTPTTIEQFLTMSQERIT